MKSKNTLRRKTSIATIALLVLASMAALPGFAPTASAEEQCHDTGNPSAIIYVRVCVDLDEEEQVPADPQLSITPKWGDEVCVVGNICASPPADVANWVDVNVNEIPVNTGDVTDFTVSIDEEAIEDIICVVAPDICKEMIALVVAVIADFVVQVASTDGENVTGVLLTADDGSAIYIGF